MESGGALNGSAAAGRFAAAGTAALGALMVLLIAVTVAGNALVMLAFVADSSLRTQNNFFLLNLAISDFLVGAFCIPLYVPYVLTGRWIFGRSLCKLWLVVDYLLCTSSVFNIVLISYDRFLSVTRAVAYRAQQGNTKRAVLKMVMVWVLAFLLYGPAIISWEYISGQSIIPTGECYAEFFYNWYFLMTASTLEFFTPFISVMFFNLSIYLNIQKRTKTRLDIFHEVHNQSFTEEMEMSPEAKLSLKRCKWEQKEPKVAKSLAIIVGIFGICWAPYTLLMIIRAGCHGHCISEYWYETSFWLLWINSAVNPVLYPLCHYSFRRAFIKLLCPKKLKIQPHDPLQNCWK
uniref:Histamine H3 receptor n=1 Tax=Aquila chrysaetos chrysaetos TaxID=223781 RepID=A0A663DVG0_AQUCH